MDKDSIDEQAEQEGNALCKQRLPMNSNSKRLKLQEDYNKKVFDRLFAVKLICQRKRRNKYYV